MLLTLLSVELTQVITDELAGRGRAWPAACDGQTIACPLPCYCRAPDYRAVRCDVGGLTSVPSSVWSVMPVSLNLSFNDITEWSGVHVTVADDQEVSCLNTLILSHSGLTHVRARSFDRLRSLRQLTLDHNHLTALDPTTFRGLEQLDLLDISHNELVLLPPSLFDDLSQLRVCIRPGSIGPILNRPSRYFQIPIPT